MTDEVTDAEMSERVMGVVTMMVMTLITIQCDTHSPVFSPDTIIRRFMPYSHPYDPPNVIPSP